MSMQRISPRAIGFGRSAFVTGIPVQRNFGLRFRWSSTGPATVVDTGFWTSLIPKPLRRENRKGPKRKKSREWNPATFFIVMFLFVGSMSIQLIALRNQTERYNRQSTVRIEQLRAALKRLQNGEEVNVDKLLGDVDESPQEADWEEMLKAIERHDESQNSRNSEVLRHAEVPLKNTMSKAPRLGADADDEPVKVEPHPPKPKSATLGNFF